MDHIFEIKDKSGRKIHLSKERWGEHIRMEHPEVNDLTEIENTLIKPDILHKSDYDENVSWYFKYNKKRKEYLMVSVKYLNGTGYVITAYYTPKTY